MGWDLDNAVALSLGLRSYVSASREPGVIVCRRGEPGDALDQLILAWSRNDRPQFEAKLGPNARAGLRSLLKGTSWAGLRSKFLSGMSRGNFAVGFRFDIQGPWSEPEETLAPKTNFDASLLNSARLTLHTLFTSRSGVSCGQYQVKFLGRTDGTVIGSGPSTPNTYLVDNSDLAGLLSLIGTCAASP